MEGFHAAGEDVTQSFVSTKGKTGEFKLRSSSHIGDAVYLYYQSFRNCTCAQASKMKNETPTPQVQAPHPTSTYKHQMKKNAGDWAIMNIEEY